MSGQPSDVTRTHEESPKALRILAIDEEVAALERIKPKMRLYASMLVPLVMLLTAFAVFVSSSTDYHLQMVLTLIWPVLLMVAVPTTIYAVEVVKNRRRRLKLERELDELIADPTMGELRAGRANWGGDEGGVIL